MGEKVHAKRHPEPKTPTRTTIQRTRDLAIQCLDVGHQGVGIPACANLDIATCKRTHRRPAVRGHPQWCLTRPTHVKVVDSAPFTICGRVVRSWA